MKLARKLTLFLVLGMCAVLALDALVSIRRELNLYEADTFHDEHVTGRAMAIAASRLWSAGGRAQVMAFIEHANEDVLHPYVRWVELDAPPGDPHAPRLPRSELAPLLLGNEVHRVVTSGANRDHFFTYVPVRVGGRVAALELMESFEVSRRYVGARIASRVASAAILVILSGLIAGVVGAVFVGDPMRRLVDKARRVGAGDLSRPLAMRQRDEIGELGREIDAMCENLAEALRRIDAETRARLETVGQLRHADRLATVGKLAAGVAHELGTPLNVVAQRAKMIATGEVEGATAREGARIIGDQAQRMTDVIRQLLGFARRDTPRKARIDLVRIAEQTTAFLTPLAARRNIALRVVRPEDSVVAEVDAGQIQQALANLIVNGIQAMADGGVVEIVLAAPVFARPPADHDLADGGYVRIDVGDQGPGIPDENRAHLFEPFFTTKEVGEGTGLGLALAYGIVREHGGWISVESSPGAGSVFTIHLPAEIGSEEAPGRSPEAALVQGT